MDTATPTTALAVWKSLLNLTPPDRKKALEQTLSPDLRATLEPLPAIRIVNHTETMSQQLEQIHPSWMVPFLRTLPENDLKLFLSCLDPAQIESVKQAVPISHALPSLSSLGKLFLQTRLLQELLPEDVLASSLLPEDPINLLLTLSAHELSHLIHLLSMHDLAVEIRQIIQTAKLQDIYKILSKSEAIYLKTLLHKKEAVTFKKMGLVSWDGNPEVLKNMLLERGLNRIAKSLYGKEKNLLWHVAHKLDIKQGQLLLKLSTPMDHPNASNFLASQVLEIVHSLKPHNPM